MKPMALLVILSAAACGTHPGPAADRPPPSPMVGAHCNLDSQCATQCVGKNDTAGDQFPGGMCTLPCTLQQQCPSGTVCVDEAGGVCVYPCATVTDCGLMGPYYRCLPKGGFAGDEYWVCMGR